MIHFLKPSSCKDNKLRFVFHKKTVYPVIIPPPPFCSSSPLLPLLSVGAVQWARWQSQSISFRKIKFDPVALNSSSSTNTGENIYKTLGRVKEPLHHIFKETQYYNNQTCIFSNRFFFHWKRWIIFWHFHTLFLFFKHCLTIAKTND